MNVNHIQNARLLGFVQVRVGAQLFSLPVQSVHFERDGAVASQPAGGFFAEGEGDAQLGILVDDEASQSEVEDQIKRGAEEAARHISRRFLN
jgi:hypothetical protein